MPRTNRCPVCLVNRTFRRPRWTWILSRHGRVNRRQWIRMRAMKSGTTFARKIGPAAGRAGTGVGVRIAGARHGAGAVSGVTVRRAKRLGGNDAARPRRRDRVRNGFRSWFLLCPNRIG